MVGLMCYLVPFLALQICVRPFKLAALNRIETGSISILLLYFLVEVTEEIRHLVKEVYGERNGESVAVAVLFVLIPSLIFFFFLVKILREQILSKAFYTYPKVFALLSCGAKSLNHFALKKVHDYEKALRQQTDEPMTNNEEIVDPKAVKLNFKRIEAIKAEESSGKIVSRQSLRETKTSRTFQSRRLLTNPIQSVALGQIKTDSSVDSRVDRGAEHRVLQTALGSSKDDD